MHKSHNPWSEEQSSCHACLHNGQCMANGAICICMQSLVAILDLSHHTVQVWKLYCTNYTNETMGNNDIHGQAVHGKPISHLITSHRHAAQLSTAGGVSPAHQLPNMRAKEVTIKGTMRVHTVAAWLMCQRKATRAV